MLCISSQVSTPISRVRQPSMKAVVTATNAPEVQREGRRRVPEPQQRVLRALEELGDGAGVEEAAPGPP
jgi:hypothetical protein